MMFDKRFKPHLLLICCLAAAPPAHAALPAAVDGRELPTLAPMLDKVMPAVVNISTQSHVRIRENPLLQDPFFRRFFDLPDARPRRRRTQSLGSGVVVDASRGYVVTNAHVIDKADEVTVTLHDGRDYSAELIGADPESDVAVIRIPARDLTALELGDSDRLRVGDFVVAIGNPFGLNQTVTSGIVSALGRSGLGIEGYEDFIQTDASINPGNSGGALVNLRGQLIGVNTAILAPSGGNVGIGFAIPINMVRRLTEQLVEYGEIRRGRLGVHIQDLTLELAQAFNIPDRRGAIIAQIEPGSPAARSGLRDGDVVVRVDDKRIDDAADLRNMVGLLRVGDTVSLGVIRGGREHTFQVRIEQAPRAHIDGHELSPLLAGARFSELVDDLGSQRDGGVVIVTIQAGSPAWSAGLRKDDIIVSVNRRPVNSIDGMRDALTASRGGLLMNIRRGDSALYLVIR